MAPASIARTTWWRSARVWPIAGVTLCSSSVSTRSIDRSSSGANVKIFIFPAPAWSSSLVSPRSIGRTNFSGCAPRFLGLMKVLAEHGVTTGGEHFDDCEQSVAFIRLCRGEEGGDAVLRQNFGHVCDVRTAVDVHAVTTTGSVDVGVDESGEGIAIGHAHDAIRPCLPERGDATYSEDPVAVDDDRSVVDLVRRGEAVAELQK
jgi:hypothetical protein